MNVIDHAILISASPTFIWRFLGDVSQNPKWQEDCTSISFLTTQHEGKGARWRYSTTKGKDVVVEITAWYDTLGYEYMIVDGSSVGENKGRMRLQEIAEGTLVQWTFNYEVEGAFSGFRNSLGLKRGLSNNIQDSLRNLYKLIQSETGGIPTHEAKALLKEAPDVEQRSSYEPRHPSNIKDNLEETFKEPDYPSEQPISYNIQSEFILEPPVAEGDTKPNPVVQGTEEISVPINVSEPSFLQQIPEPPVTEDDTEPNAPISDNEISTYSTIEEISESIIEPIESPKSIIPLQDNTPKPEVAPPPQPTSPTIPSKDIRDTASVSVFDIFGLQKPSETQEIRTLSEQELSQSEDEPILPISSVATQETGSVEEPTSPDAIESPINQNSDESEVKINNIVEEKSVVTEVGDTLEEEVETEIEVQSEIVQPVKYPSVLRIAGLRLMSRRKVIRVRTRK